jgi:hypothetical protein
VVTLSSRSGNQSLPKPPDPKDEGTKIFPNAGTAQPLTQGNTLKHPDLHKTVLTIK